MPFDMAVEKPNSRVVGLEAEDDVTIWAEDEGISSHWGCRVHGLAAVGGIKGTGFFFRTGDGLESMTVEMKGVLPGI